MFVISFFTVLLPGILAVWLHVKYQGIPTLEDFKVGFAHQPKHYKWMP